MKMRRIGYKKQYLVQWKGNYPNPWKPDSYITGRFKRQFYIPRTQMDKKRRKGKYQVYRKQCTKHYFEYNAGPGNAVGCASDWYSVRCDPLALQHAFVEIGQKIISTAILSLPLLRVGLLSVTCERMYTKYWLTP